MTKVIKLSKKQLELISSTQKQKTEISKAFQEVAQKEAIAIDLILDVNGITEQIQDIKFENDTLIVTLPEPKPLKVVDKYKKKKSKVVTFEDPGAYNQG